MSITRKQFCAAIAGAGVLAVLPACGGGDDAAPAGGGGPTSRSCGASGAEIVPEHGHVLSVPAADLDSTVAMTYSILGTAGHDHQVTLSVAQLVQLKGGATVTVTSTTTDFHAHQVTVSCTP